MPVNKKNRDPIPQNFNSVDEFDEFWSTHSTADYDDLFHDVHFNIKLEDEPISLKPAVARALRTRARQQNMSVNDLINVLLEEKLKEAA